jgi:hypothetical protein
MIMIPPPSDEARGVAICCIAMYYCCMGASVRPRWSRRHAEFRDVGDGVVGEVVVGRAEEADAAAEGLQRADVVMLLPATVL